LLCRTGRCLSSSAAVRWQYTLLLLLLLLLQVFPTSAWAELYDALNSSVAAGGPAYHLAEYTVMDNPFMAVHGGWQVGTVCITLH
jgi:hypothetical protein